MLCRVLLEMHAADCLNLHSTPNALRVDVSGWEDRRATNGEAIAQACRWVFYVVLVVQREGIVAWMPGGA
jgi:hypothetical protein